MRGTLRALNTLVTNKEHTMSQEQLELPWYDDATNEGYVRLLTLRKRTCDELALALDELAKKGAVPDELHNVMHLCVVTLKQERLLHGVLK